MDWRVEEQSQVAEETNQLLHLDYLIEISIKR